MNNKDIKLVAEALNIHGLYDLKGTLVWIGTAKPFDILSPENVLAALNKLITDSDDVRIYGLKPESTLEKAIISTLLEKIKGEG